MKADNHILTIDAARGLLACAVLFYHELFFNGIIQLERIAYYAVYGFFIISGFAMFVAYHDKIATAGDVRAYLLKRYFRIAPLYFAVLVVRMCLGDWPGDILYRLVLNLTLTFGLANPGVTSLLGGGWSIGIEMVFYLLFPIVMIVTRGRILWLFALAIGALFVQIRFINIVLAGHVSMVEPGVWLQYTQPVAMAGYFVGGLVLGAIFLQSRDMKGKWWSAALIVMGLLPFLFVRTDTTLQLLTGNKGALLLASAFAIIAGAAFLPEPKGWLKSVAVRIGVLSYPVYLIHPVADVVLRGVIPKGYWHVAAVFVLTVVASIVVSRYIERPARAFGRRLAARRPSPAACGQ